MHTKEDQLQLLKSADYLFMHRKYKQATANYYKKVIKQYPKYIPRIILKFEIALLADPENIDIKTSLIDLMLAEDNYSEAIDELEELIEIDPFNIEYYKLLSRQYLKLYKYQDVVNLILKPYSMNLCDEGTINLLAAAYLELGKTQESIGVYEKLIAINGEKEAYLRVLSDLYYHDEKYIKAVGIATKRLEYNKKSYADVINFIEKCYTQSNEDEYIRKILIDLCITYNKPDEAIILIRYYVQPEFILSNQEYLSEKVAIIYKDFPGLAEALLLQADYYNLTGAYSQSADAYWELCKNEHFEKFAIDGLLGILEMYPNQLSVLQYLGEYYKIKGSTDKSLMYMRRMLGVDVSKSIAVISQCKDLIEDDPHNYYAKLTMAEAYFNRENYRGAIEISIELIKRGERGFDATFVLLNSYIALKDYAAIREIFIKDKNSFLYQADYYNLFNNVYTQELALRRDVLLIKVSKSEELFDKIPYIEALIECNDLEKAIIEIQAIIRVEQNYILYYYLGLVYLYLGKYFSAAGSFKKAMENVFVENAPENIRLLEKLAITYEIVGEIDKSLDYLRQILEIDYRRDDIKEREQALKDCPYLDVAGKSLIVISSDLSGQNIISIFNRNILRKKHKETLDSSMGILKNNEAVDEIFKGKINSAFDLIDMAFKMDPSHKNILNNRGIISILSGDYEDAINTYEQILRNKQDVSAAALYNLSFIYTYKYKQYKVALELIKKLLSFEERLHEAYLILGDIYYYLDDIESAKENWDIYRKNGLLPLFAYKRLFEIDFVSQL